MHYWHVMVPGNCVGVLSIVTLGWFRVQTETVALGNFSCKVNQISIEIQLTYEKPHPIVHCYEIHYSMYNYLNTKTPDAGGVITKQNISINQLKTLQK